MLYFWIVGVTCIENCVTCHTRAISTNSLVLYEGDEETGEPFLGTYQGRTASVGQYLISSQEQLTPRSLLSPLGCTTSHQVVHRGARRRSREEEQGALQGMVPKAKGREPLTRLYPVEESHFCTGGSQRA